MNHHTHSQFCLLIFTLASLVLFAQDSGKEAYQKAMKAYSQKSYKEALSLYDKAFEQDASLRDSALFWKASSHFKLGQFNQTLNLLTNLLDNYPDSRWREDAEALQAETLASTGKKPSKADLNELSPETVMVFLSHLPEGEAIPLIKSILDREGDSRYQDQALFALTQLPGKVAKEMLRTYALDDQSHLNSQALQYLAISQDPENLEILRQKYKRASTQKSKQELLGAFMVGGDFKMLLEVAKTESDPELMQQAIVLLGTMGEEASLIDLYTASKEKSRRLAILEGLALGQNSTFLRDAFSKETDESVKEKMISYLGLAGDCDAIDQIFQTSTSQTLRLACVDALLIAMRCQLLQQWIASETDNEVRIRLIRHMGMFGDAYLEELNDMYQMSQDSDVKEAVLNAFFIGQHAKSLLKIAESETNPELRATAIQFLSLTGSEEAVEFLKKKLNRQ